MRAPCLRRCHESNFPLGKKDVFCPRCGAKQRREKANPAIMAAASIDATPPFPAPPDPEQG
jgi:uncharacterized Zn finger protein (UPF0148 family)